MPYGAEVEEMVCVAMGGVDSYDFHALEVIQCMAERRRGGETGVRGLAGLRGDAVWKAMQAGSWAGAAGIRGYSRPACAAARRWLSPKRIQRPLSDASPNARVGQGAGRSIASNMPTA